jgi:membrane-bound serine protease (ClpP class)
VGRQGVAMTVLRPAGRAQIGDDFVDVVSEGPFISAGRKIEVLSVSGNRVVVREIA